MRFNMDDRSKSSGTLRRRAIAFIMVIVVIFCACCYRLMQFQVVGGDDYRQQADRKIISTTPIKAPRGEILDIYGRPLAKNKVVFNIIFDRAFLPQGRENVTILRLIDILRSAGEEWIDTLPMSKNPPYDFEEGREADIERLKSKILRVNSYATAQDCYDTMKEKYNLNIPEGAGNLERLMMGVRYEMELKDFSLNNIYTFAENISTNTLAKISELNTTLPGVDVDDVATRDYVNGNIASHIIGFIGPIDDLEQLKAEADPIAGRTQNYKLSDFKGKSGVELAMEKYLRGLDGKRQVTQNVSGEVLQKTTVEPPRPGCVVTLTIDRDFQQKTQDLLQTHVDWQKSHRSGRNSKGGAVAVVGVKTGEVLALANYPSYDLANFRNNIAELNNDPLKPMINRCLYGLYRPGSTFKTVMAVAGLSEGVITRHSTFNCATYRFHDVDFRCLRDRHSGAVSLMTAMRYSCNVYFYNTGNLLGIDNIKKYANACGLGVDTGLELMGPNPPGRVAHPSDPIYSRARSNPWYAGNTIQASIGQSDTMVSPLQMAVSVATIANKGVRMKSHVIKSVQSYDLSEMIYETKPAVAEKIDADASVFEAVTASMVEGSKNITGVYGFADLPFDVAVKTGTPQEGGNNKFNSAIVAFWPANDPEVAMAVMLEEGTEARRIVRQVIDAYYSSKTRSGGLPQDTNILL
ncbi:MAG: penicillin-binding transpeptidase domain-containing protein [Oscillospiraceae bacterium]|nr:penicillin-binding transpeptidase domain-containing protein [Oscillospiraceae bacterium]